MNGYFRADSAHAELLVDSLDDGGVLIAVNQRHGGNDDEALIKLSADQVKQLVSWLSMGWE